jgi:hypothetical protein
MADQKTALMSLRVGDIFHAESPNGASLICLVLSVTETDIEARRVTTQDHLTFDRQTGIKKSEKRTALCAIDSIAPLPEEIHKIMLFIDHKFRPGQGLTTDADFERLKLSNAEKKALNFVTSYYPSNPL